MTRFDPNHYLFALYFNMVPDSQRGNIVPLLVSGTYGIANYNSGYTSDGFHTIYCTNHLSTGYFFSSRTMLELSRDGYTGLAYQLLLNTNFPSWLYSVVNGATTCWEGWNAYLSGPQNPAAPSDDRGYYYVQPTWDPFTSLNHLPLGASAEWILKVIGGINPDDTNPGFQNVIIKPEPNNAITNCFAAFNSIHGPIVCTWTNNVSTSTYTLAFTNPANTTATVYFPTTNNLAGIMESGRSATTAPGVIFYYPTNWPNWTNGATVFQVGSGGFRFSLTNVIF